ncbi:MAG TPA: hypothetical protein VER14_05770 [Phototrophicaceae bacterium]|nr:hypothetical protein [Phototrophicaceae bacterium]
MFCFPCVSTARMSEGIVDLSGEALLSVEPNLNNVTVNDPFFH